MEPVTAEFRPGDEVALAAHCANCGKALIGRYCSDCGQRAVALRPTLHDLLHEGIHEFVHVDGKILQTLKLLVIAPGRLTREFIEGRRARYITPIRLYLICSVIFFAVVSLIPTRPWHVAVSGKSFARLQRGANRVNSNPEMLSEAFKHNLPRVAFVLMPLMGALVFVAYRKREPTYVPHLYFAVHYHAFLFLLMTLIALISAYRSLWTAFAGFLLFLGSLPYLVASLRTVYGGSRVMTIAKGTAIWAIYGMCVLAAVLAIMLLTVFEAARAPQ